MTNQEFVAAAKKNPISFGCAALSMVLVIALYLRSEAIPEAEAELTQRSAESERLALNIKYSAQLKEQAEALIAANKEIETRIIRASQLGNNTQYFYQLESNTGVKIIDLRQTTPVSVVKPAKSAFVPVGFAVTVQGSLAQILEFLRHVESGSHYARILTANCSGGAGVRGTPLTLGLTLELLGLP